MTNEIYIIILFIFIVLIDAAKGALQGLLDFMKLFARLFTFEQKMTILPLQTNVRIDVRSLLCCFL